MRRRMIDPSIWDDPDIGTLSPSARLLFIGCFSLADDFGNILAMPRYLQKRLFGYDADVSTEQVTQWLDEIVGLRATTLYPANGQAYLHFNNWTTHQKLDSRYTPKASCPPFPNDTNEISPEPPADGDSPVNSSSPEESDVKAPHSSDIKRDAALSKVNISEVKSSKEKKSSTSANAERASPVLSVLAHYEIALADLKSDGGKKKAIAIARAFYLVCFGGINPPGFGYVGKAVNMAGDAGYFCQLCLETAAQRPSGSPMQYIMGILKRKGGRRRSAPKQPINAIADANDPDIAAWLKKRKGGKNNE